MNGQNPFVPTLSQQEYLKRLKAAGYGGKQALGIMVDSGFDSESVKADLLAEYEREREEFLRKQEELRKQREAEIRRREQLEAEREERDNFFAEQKKRVYLPNLRAPLYDLDSTRRQLTQPTLRELKN